MNAPVTCFICQCQLRVPNREADFCAQIFWRQADHLCSADGRPGTGLSCCFFGLSRMSLYFSHLLYCFSFEWCIKHNFSHVYPGVVSTAAGLFKKNERIPCTLVTTKSFRTCDGSSGAAAASRRSLCGPSSRRPPSPENIGNVCPCGVCTCSPLRTTRNPAPVRGGSAVLRAPLRGRRRRPEDADRSWAGFWLQEVSRMPQLIEANPGLYAYFHTHRTDRDHQYFGGDPEVAERNSGLWGAFMALACYEKDLARVFTSFLHT